MKKLFIIFILLFCINCTNEKGAKDLLEKEGYTEIEMTGYNWFSCSKDDSFHTGFKARNMKGNIVEGTVCESLFFKDKTIRFK
jgi:hypothetical protein